MPISPRTPRIHLKQPLKIDARFPLRFTGLLANPSIPHRLKQSFIHLLRASFHLMGGKLRSPSWSGRKIGCLGGEGLCLRGLLASTSERLSPLQHSFATSFAQCLPGDDWVFSWPICIGCLSQAAGQTTVWCSRRCERGWGCGKPAAQLIAQNLCYSFNTSLMLRNANRATISNLRNLVVGADWRLTIELS